MMYRKILFALMAGACFAAGEASAAPKECSYIPLQQLIRTARGPEDITKLINKKVNLNFQHKCGGNAYQLAILRGNASIVKTLIEQSKIPLDMKVSNADYPIPGAPKEIPLVFFAAYYSPSIEIMKLFVDNGADIMVNDAKGETILKYLNQNPVLINTALVDEIMDKLIMAGANENAAADAASDKKEVKKEVKKEAPQNNAKPQPAPKKEPDKKEAKQKADSTGTEDFGVVEKEPDAPFKPEDSALNQVDF